MPDDQVLESVSELMAGGENAPLAHELLLEATAIQAENRRSSLLIGISAAEIGVKSFISRIVPHAEWLAMHAPSAPIVQILEEYLPRLPIAISFGSRHNVRPIIPKPFLKKLQTAVKLRNDVTHAGGTISSDKLREVLFLIYDLLYLLDGFAGFTWAFRNVSTQTMEMLRKAIEEAQSESSSKAK